MVTAIFDCTWRRKLYFLCLPFMFVNKRHKKLAKCAQRLSLVLSAAAPPPRKRTRQELEALAADVQDDEIGPERSRALKTLLGVIKRRHGECDVERLYSYANAEMDQLHAPSGTSCRSIVDLVGGQFIFLNVLLPHIHTADVISLCRADLRAGLLLLAKDSGSLWRPLAPMITTYWANRCRRLSPLLAATAQKLDAQDRLFLSPDFVIRRKSEKYVMRAFGASILDDLWGEVQSRKKRGLANSRPPISTRPFDWFWLMEILMNAAPWSLSRKETVIPSWIPTYRDTVYELGYPHTLTRADSPADEPALCGQRIIGVLQSTLAWAWKASKMVVLTSVSHRYTVIQYAAYARFVYAFLKATPVTFQDGSVSTYWGLLCRMVKGRTTHLFSSHPEDHLLKGTFACCAKEGKHLHVRPSTSIPLVVACRMAAVAVERHDILFQPIVAHCTSITRTIGTDTCIECHWAFECFMKHCCGANNMDIPPYLASPRFFSDHP